MKYAALILSLILILLSASLALASANQPVSTLPTVQRLALTPTYGFGALPGRGTSTPAPEIATAEATEDAPSTLDCLAAFPIETIEAITFGRTTSAQLRAAFGEPITSGGRATTLRFEERGCTLLVTLGGDEVQEAELQAYGTLGWLLDEYGPPEAAGTAQGNLALPLAGSAVLFYPEDGITALFEADPDALDHDTPITSLFFRTPYPLDRQVHRLKVELAERLPPPLR